MTRSGGYDERGLAQLLRALPPAPEAWVRAAQELPALTASLEEILARAEADARFRDALIADLEATLGSAGYEPEPGLVERLERELRHPEDGTGEAPR